MQNCFVRILFLIVGALGFSCNYEVELATAVLEFCKGELFCLYTAMYFLQNLISWRNNH